jgi:hypothetical protein
MLYVLIPIAYILFMHGIDPSDIDLMTEKVSALPIINSYLERLYISGLLSGRMESSQHMPVQSCLMVLIRNIIMEREPVYGIAEWTSSFAPSLLGLTPDQVKLINITGFEETLIFFKIRIGIPCLRILL